MKLDNLIEKVSRKISRKNLIVMIIVLSLAILSLLGLIFKNNIISIGSSIGSSISDPAASSDSSPQASSGAPLVVIDPGHGGSEPGAGNGSVNEKDTVLAISLEVEKILKEKHVDSILTRNDDIFLSLEDRVKIANEKKCSLFVSIHNNSFTDPSSSGILTTYNPYSPTGADIAEIMQSKLRDIGMQNRKTMPRPNLYVLRHTEMPALLLEIGFISNKKDLSLITNADFQKKCAGQIVSGIEEILAKDSADASKSSSED